jgi:hypothetical protein
VLEFPQRLSVKQPRPVAVARFAGGWQHGGVQIRENKDIK